MTWKYFSLDDPDDRIACPCCGELVKDELFYRHMALLDYLRERLGFPVFVNSGHRCKEHNADIGGSKGSMHLRFATDIRPGDNDPDKLRRILELAPDLGFTGIGTYRTFAHLDLRQKPARWNG